MTDSERKLWSGLRGEQLGVKFRRQHPLGNYIADFACLGAEADRRTGWIAACTMQAWNTTRSATRFFARKDSTCCGSGTTTLLTQSRGVLQASSNQLAASWRACPHPSPPPEAGEGARHQEPSMKQLQDAYIVAATRTPIGRSHRGFFRNTRPDDLLATTLRAALAQVPGLDPKAIEDIICGCAIPEAQQGLNVARIGAVLAGLPNQRRRHHGQPLLRFGPVGGADGGRPHPRRRGRGDDRGRRREHEHGADDGQLALAVALDLQARRSKARHRLRHGPHGREGGAAVEGEPRGAGRLRAAVAPARAGGAAGRRVRRRDHADRGDGRVAGPGDGEVPMQDPHREPRRRRAPRHHPRRPGQAAHGVRRARHGHRRQQLADFRRRRRADPRERERPASDSA